MSNSIEYGPFDWIAEIDIKAFDAPIDDVDLKMKSCGHKCFLDVCFIQEAEKSILEDCKLYLRCKHVQNDVLGLKLFKKIDNGRPEEYYVEIPQDVCEVGNVQAFIEIVNEKFVVRTDKFLVNISEK